jgi:DNA-binding transcriptional MerR regulator
MPDYFLREHFAAKLGISESELAKFELEGVIRPLAKKGRLYFPSSDLYRVKAILHFMRADGLSLHEARVKLQEITRQALRFSSSASRA